MSARSLLVISGNYDIIQRVRQVVSSDGIAVQAAYSHLDALYLIRTTPFDAVLVDAAMTDRQTGVMTTEVLMRYDHCPPMVAYLSKESNSVNGNLGTEIYLTALDEKSIRRAVSQAMRPPFASWHNATHELIQLSDGSQEEVLWWPDEIQTLFDLSRSLTEVLDQGEVLNRVVEAARRLTDAEEGMILLPDEEGGQLYLRAKVGIENEVARNFRIRTKDTLAGHVYNTGEPILIGARGPQKIKTEYFANSLLYVPILLKGKPIGVLGVNNRIKEDVFDRRHRELLLNLGSYAAIAIENARVHGQSIKRARELKALVDASEAFNASLSLEHTLPSIGEQFMRVLNVSQTRIYAWQAEHQRLLRVAMACQSIWRPGANPVWTFFERPALRRAFESRKPVTVRARAGDFADEERLLEREALSQRLIVPIGGEYIVGLMQVNYVNLPEMEPTKDLLHRVGHLALELLNDFADNPRQSGSTAPKRLLDLVAMLNADWCDLGLVTHDETALDVLVSAGGGLWLGSVQPALEMAGHDDILQLIAKQSILNQRADGETLHLGARLLFDDTGARSLLVLPMISRGNVWGLVAFADTEHHYLFNSREVDLGRAIVGQAVTALENARLYTDLEASLRQLQETQERLILTERLSAMGELAAAVAHQINNPLTTIVLDTELLLLNTPPETPAYKSLQAIERAGKRAASVVRRLLATVRNGVASGPPEPIDVKLTVEETMALVRAHIERGSIELSVSYPHYPLPAVTAVPGELDDVWLNLLLNSYDAIVGRKDAKMGIDVRYEPGWSHLDVIVWDNGPGIPWELREEIFKPFFTTKPIGEGTGLGLHICRQVVERIGGTISLETEEGQGARFLVRLPVMRRN